MYSKCKEEDDYPAHNITQYPSKFFLALQSFCCHLSVVLLSYDSRLTITMGSHKKIWLTSSSIQEEKENFQFTTATGATGWNMS